MALSGHLTAIQCGLASALFGVIWSQVVLPRIFEIFVAYGCVIGFMLIWLGITVASVTGASKALPITGAGFTASVSSEFTVKLLVRTGSVLSLIACTLLVYGLAPMLQ